MSTPVTSRYRTVARPVSSPLAIPLTRPSTWKCKGDENGPYEIVRFNFLVEERPLLETGYGTASASISAPTGAEIQTREKVLFEYQQVDSSSIVQEHLQSSGLTTKMSADARLSSEAFGSAGFASALEEHFTESFRAEQTVSTVRTTSFSREEEVTVTVSDSKERYVHAAPYRLHEMSVRLNHVDYLTVTYEPTHAGLRVRRSKSPALVDNDKSHANFTKWGLLLGSYRFWRREGDAGRNLIPLSEYEAEQINPQDVIFIPDGTDNRRFYGLDDFTRTPSLYKISNAAFPLKESQRRENWSEEELLALDDWILPDSAWAWEARRRRRRKG